MKGFLWRAKSSEQGPHCGLCLSWSDSTTDTQLCVSFGPVRGKLLMSKSHSLRSPLQPLPLAQAPLWAQPREQFTNLKWKKSLFVLQGEAIPCGSAGGRQMYTTHKPETWPPRTKYVCSVMQQLWYLYTFTWSKQKASFYKVLLVLSVSLPPQPTPYSWIQLLDIFINNSGSVTEHYVQMISRWRRGTELQAIQKAGFEFRKSNNLKGFTCRTINAKFHILEGIISHTNVNYGTSAKEAANSMASKDGETQACTAWEGYRIPITGLFKTQ